MENLTEHKLSHPVVQLLVDNGLDGLPEAMRILMNEAMAIERSQALQAQPYERTEQRLGHANGFKDKDFHTRIGTIKLDIPQVRGPVKFYPSALGKGQRSEQALTAALAEMYVQGVSTRKTTAILEQLCGLEISSSQVSQATAKLDVQFEAWRQRPLGTFPYLVVDARYEKVRVDGRVRDCAVLITIGISLTGQRTILGVSVSLSEAEVHWREFFNGLIARGLRGVTFIVSDDHAGLRQARQACFPGAPWQRCQFHLQQNAQAYVPKIDMRNEAAQAIRSIFDAPDQAKAQERLKDVVKQFQSKAPKLAEWIENNVPEGLAVFGLPQSHQRRMRTSNSAERLNQELKRRTRVVRVFPNDASLLRLVTALLVEQSDQWETEKTYLTMKAINL
nr:IS256 family transposase [uncultured Methanoregula sp.]